MALDPTGAMSTMAPFAQAQMTGQNQNPTLKGMVNLKNMIDQAESAYLADSSIYDEEQVMQLNQVSQQVRGRRFGPKGNINSDVSGDNFIYGMANTALFGAPEFIARGLFNSSLAGDTAAEKKAFGYGEIAGIAPALFTGGAAFRGLQAGAKAMGAGTKLAAIMAGATEGGIYGALTGAASDPNVGPTGLSAKGAVDQGLMNAGIGGIVGPLGGSKIADKAGGLMKKLRGGKASFMRRNTKDLGFMSRLQKMGADDPEVLKAVERSTTGFYTPAGAKKIVKGYENILKRGDEPSEAATKVYNAVKSSLDDGRAKSLADLSNRYKSTKAVGVIASREGAESAAKFADEVAELGWKSSPLKKGFRTQRAHQDEVEAFLNSLPDDEVIKFKKGLDYRKELAATSDPKKVIELSGKIRAIEGPGATIKGTEDFIQSRITPFFKERAGMPIDDFNALVIRSDSAIDKLVKGVSSMSKGAKSGARAGELGKLAKSQGMRRRFRDFFRSASETERASVEQMLDSGKYAEAARKVMRFDPKTAGKAPVAVQATQATTPTAPSGTAAPISTAEAPATGAPASSENILGQLKQSQDQGQMGIV